MKDTAALTLRFELGKPPKITAVESSDVAARALADQLDAAGLTPLLAQLVDRIDQERAR